MEGTIIHAENLFGQKNRQSLTAAFMAVNFPTPYEQLHSEFLTLKFAVQNMREMQKKRERDLNPKVWEMASNMEKQVDAIAFKSFHE